MLIPVCCDRLPVRLDITILYAKGLPIMDKSINSTDAFVEIHFDDEVEKTDVVTDLNPSWDAEKFHFDTDEKTLSEKPVQFRVMDHDTYSANDAIGRFNLDCNAIVEYMRFSGRDDFDQTLQLPIYDTLLGIRGELTVNVVVQLLVSNVGLDPYVRFISGSHISDEYRVTEVCGLVTELKTEKDPEYEWLDRIRTPRVTNEARQADMRALLREAAVSVAERAHQIGANVVMAYQEFVDIEGSSSGLFAVRVYGTAVKVDASRECTLLHTSRIALPVLSITSLPPGRQVGIGAMVAARAVHSLDDGEDAEQSRKRWWAELRSEIFQQAMFLSCNTVIAYSEQCAINDGVAILGVTGTAVVLGSEDSIIPPVNRDNANGKSVPLSAGPLECAQFHASFASDKPPFPVHLSTCGVCKSEEIGDMLISTAVCPSTEYLIGPRNIVQVSVTKKIAADPDDLEEYADEISNLLPYIDHELYNNLLQEGKTINPQGNALFNLRISTSFSDDLFVSVATAIVVRLSAITREELTTPVISSVLSFSNLQRNNDARRFSWGSVREAIRLKPATTPSIAMKILHLRQPKMESLDENGHKQRSKMSTLVDRLRRRNHEKEYLSHVVFERELCVRMGVCETAAGYANSHSEAGIHMTSASSSLVLSREQLPFAAFHARWREVLIREDVSSTMKDSSSVDTFLTLALEDCLGVAKCALSSCVSSSLACLSINSPHLSVSRDKAQLVVLIAADLSSFNA